MSTPRTLTEGERLTRSLMQRAADTLAYGGLVTVVEDALVHAEGSFPQFAVRGDGCRLQDSAGQVFVDWFLGWGAMALGHRRAEVVAAVAEQLERGPNLTLMAPVEVEVAERIVAMVPCAERVVFAKNGTDATTIAVRIARAATGRDGILACGYHGFADWSQALNPAARGVPAVLKGEIAAFPYDDLDAIASLLDQHGHRCAALILEPMHDRFPGPGYLAGLRELTERHGCLLIFDEVVTGFRVARGGAQELFGVIPDLACYGKALANGFPLSACAGRARYMRHYPDIGLGLTYRGEAMSLAAARASLEIYEHEPVTARLSEVGNAIAETFRRVARELNLEWELCGHPVRQNVHPRGAGRISKAGAAAVFLQGLTKAGVLCNGVFFACTAHDADAVAISCRAVERALRAVGHALSTQRLEDVLDYPVRAGFYVD